MNAGRPGILVTGAGGFIGTELCRQLAAEDCRLVRLVRRASAGTQAQEPGLETPDFSGDIRDAALLKRALEGVDTVFHLAGIAHVDGSDRDLLQAVNVDATVALADAAAGAGVRRLVYFSSSLALAAEQGLNCATQYGHSKLAAERRLAEVAGQTRLDVTVLRPVNVYGSGMKGNLATLIRLIRRGLLPPLPKPATRQSLVGVEDLCKAARLAARHDTAAGRTYLISDGEDYRLGEIEAAIYQALGRNPPRWRTPAALWWTAALLAELARRLHLSDTSLGLRSYRNLVNDNILHDPAPATDLGFEPAHTLYTALPTLIGLK